MIAAACTPVAVRNASLPASGYCGGVDTWVARGAVVVGVGEAGAAAEVDRVGAELEHAREVPVLGVLPDRRRADEAQDLELDADLLRDVDHRLDIVQVRPRGAAGLDREPVALDVLGDR